MADEIAAMSQIQKALEPLEPDEIQRVVTWAVEYARSRLGADLAAAPVSSSHEARGGPDLSQQHTPGGPERAGFTRIGDLMDAAEPNSGAEQVLVAAYWFQELQGNETVTAQQVNGQLKDLGHRIPNITEAFNSLKGRKPALARQVEKSGTTRQARKRYRLTQAGIRHVEQLLAGTGAA